MTREQIQKYRWEITDIYLDIVLDHCAGLIPGRFNVNPVFRFYLGRIKSSINYSLYQGREIIKTVCRCAFNDSQLTDIESIVLIELCHDVRLDNILLEVNYNESW